MITLLDRLLSYLHIRNNVMLVQERPVIYTWKAMLEKTYPEGFFDNNGRWRVIEREPRSNSQN